MKRGFRGAPRPLLPSMLLVATTNPNAGQEHHAVTQSQPSSSTLPVPSTSSPPVQSPPPIPTPTPTPIPTPIPETEPAPFEHTFEEPSPVHQHFSPPQEQAHRQITMDDLLQVVPQLISRIDSLETDLKQTKLTMGNALVKLVKKVKKLEGFLKRRNMEGDIREEKNLRKDRYVKLGLQEKLILPKAGKAPMIIEETPKKSKEQILQEEASLAEAIRLDTLQKEEVAKQIKANAELSKSMLGSDLQGEDFAKKMVDLVNQRKKYFAEERARAKRNKPMTQSQLKTYMMNYLKNQGHEVILDLKEYGFKEVKEEFG
ncbi:hypothetical protein Tco_0289842 [Tanacetum coccineum]